MSLDKTLTRRIFVGGAALAAGAAARKPAKAAPMPTPRVVGANDRLRVGVIGAGGNAKGHMKALMGLAEQDHLEIAAVCDIYQPRREKAAELTGGEPYSDYRRLLERKDLDYVTISVPEHWHAQITLDAADLGLHIYCEKPLTYSIEEGVKVRKRIHEGGIKLQVGIQGMSDDSYETAAQYIKDGAIGKPVMAQIDYSRNHLDDFWARPADEDAQPGVNLDWKTFLGSAPQREWAPDRFFGWRRYWDYSGGIAPDLFVHRLARIVKACELKTPERVVTTGGMHYFKETKAEVPDTFNTMLEYQGGFSVLLVSSLASEAKIRHMIRGHEGSLEFVPGGFEITPERLFKETRKPITHTRSGGEDMSLHHHNLHNAIRHGEALKCDVDVGFYASMACQMAVESYRRREYLAWDAASENLTTA